MKYFQSDAVLEGNQNNANMKPDPTTFGNFTTIPHNIQT